MRTADELGAVREGLDERDEQVRIVLCLDLAHDEVRVILLSRAEHVDASGATGFRSQAIRPCSTGRPQRTDFAAEIAKRRPRIICNERATHPLAILQVLGDHRRRAPPGVEHLAAGQRRESQIRRRFVDSPDVLDCVREQFLKEWDDTLTPRQ